MNWKIATAIMVAAAVVVAVVLVADSGDDGGEMAQSRETNGAFMAEMTDHHEAAIEMAEIAQQRGEHAEVKQLAGEIIAAQSSEIEDFNSISDRMFGEPVGASDHGTLGLSASQMGMHGDASTLETEKPFDRAFIDMMIPHHQGAIRMARIELEQGEDEELAMIAEAIIAVPRDRGDEPLADGVVRSGVPRRWRPRRGRDRDPGARHHGALRTP